MHKVNKKTFLDSTLKLWVTKLTFFINNLFCLVWTENDSFDWFGLESRNQLGSFMGGYIL
jgi:hypothetical protein